MRAPASSSRSGGSATVRADAPEDRRRRVDDRAPVTCPGQAAIHIRCRVRGRAAPRGRSSESSGCTKTSQAGVSSAPRRRRRRALGHPARRTGRRRRRGGFGRRHRARLAARDGDQVDATRRARSPSAPSCGQPAAVGRPGELEPRRESRTAGAPLRRAATRGRMVPVARRHVTPWCRRRVAQERDLRPVRRPGGIVLGRRVGREASRLRLADDLQPDVPVRPRRPPPRRTRSGVPSGEKLPAAGPALRRELHDARRREHGPPPAPQRDGATRGQEQNAGDGPAPAGAEAAALRRSPPAGARGLRVGLLLHLLQLDLHVRHVLEAPVGLLAQAAQDRAARAPSARPARARSAASAGPSGSPRGSRHSSCRRTGRRPVTIS